MFWELFELVFLGISWKNYYFLSSFIQLFVCTLKNRSKIKNNFLWTICRSFIIPAEVWLLFQKLNSRTFFFNGRFRSTISISKWSICIYEIFDYTSLVECVSNYKKERKNFSKFYLIQNEQGFKREIESAPSCTLIFFYMIITNHYSSSFLEK